jgi:hypothetical protein
MTLKLTSSPNKVLFSTYAYTQNGGSHDKMDVSHDKMDVSQMTSSFPASVQLENSNSLQQMHQPDESNPHPPNPFR